MAYTSVIPVRRLERTVDYVQNKEKIKFLINQAIFWLEEYNQDSLYIDAAMDELRNVLKELED